jgi:hypothetical protein
MKLGIFFETFVFLQKKQNFDKANYISNSSFFKYYYRNKLGGSVAYDTACSVLFFLLSSIAFVGWLQYGHINYGYLNYYYGDTNEYYFIKIFIYVIIFLAFINLPTLATIMMSLDDKSDILIKNEKELKTYLVENLDYKLLYDYYKANGVSAVSKDFSIQNVNLSSKSTADLYKFCLTYYILIDDRFMLIKNDLMGLIQGASIDEKTTTDTNAVGEQIKKALLDTTNFYIVARYNHNNNVVLPSLQNTLSIIKTKANETSKNHLSGIITGAKVSEIKEMNGFRTTTIDKFKDTIKIYKEIYDVYYSYYILNILITNFFVFYAIIVFIYLIFKIALNSGADWVEDGYNMYYFFKSLSSAGVYMPIIFYYFITSPIILFGFN